MTKNTIRKGLALGLGTALLASAVAAVPATAAVDDTAISLVPFSGTQYSMVTDGVFDLKSTQSTVAASSTGKISYKVTDAGKISKFDYQASVGETNNDTQMASLAFAASGTIQFAYDESTGIGTFSEVTNDDDFADLAVGDIVKLTGINSAAITTAFDAHVQVATVAVDDESFTFVLAGINGTDGTGTDGDIAAEDLSAGALVETSNDDILDDFATISAGTLGVAGVTVLAAPTPAADGSYVIVVLTPIQPRPTYCVWLLLRQVR